MAPENIDQDKIKLGAKLVAEVERLELKIEGEKAILKELKRQLDKAQGKVNAFAGNLAQDEFSFPNEQTAQASASKALPAHAVNAVPKPTANKKLKKGEKKK